MKIRNMLLPIMLVIVLGFNIYGQSKQVPVKKTIMKKNDISKTLGKPVFARTADSLNTRVWIISQAKNREILKTKVVKMKDTDTKTMDKETKADLMAGNYFVILDVTNTGSGKEFADSSAKVSIVSPSQKITSANFIPMMSYFGAGVGMQEKGDYLFTININIGMGYKTTQFKYTLK
jgi:hypothetical protein